MSRFVIALALTAGIVVAASEAAVADGPVVSPLVSDACVTNIVTLADCGWDLGQ